MLLTDLNDDCLQHIFKYLDYKDQLKLTNFERFEGPLQEAARFNYKTFNTLNSRYMPQKIMKNFFVFAGGFVKIMEINFQNYCDICDELGSLCRQCRSWHKMCSFIKTYCPNVQKLSILPALISTSEFKDIVTNKPMLRVLYIPRTKKWSNSSEWFNIIKELKLESLYVRLPDCDVTVDVHFPNLVRLDLHTGDVPKNLAEMTRLKALSLWYCEEYVLEALTELPAFQRNLETLYIRINACSDEGRMYTSYWNFEWSKKLKNLKHTRFDSNSEKFHLGLLVEHTAEQLQSLLYYGIPDQLIDVEHSQRIAKLKHLRKLHLNHCSVTDNGLKVLSTLKNLGELVLRKCHDFTKIGLLYVIEKCCHLRWLNIVGSDIDSIEFIKQLLPVLKSRNADCDGGCLRIIMDRCKGSCDELGMEVLLKKFQTVDEKPLAKFYFEEYKKCAKDYQNFYDVFENCDGFDEGPFLSWRHYVL